MWIDQVTYIIYKEQYSMSIKPSDDQLEKAIEKIFEEYDTE